ncbi:peptidoglycan DD-metalloendopeptidase family protein [Alteromonas sp. KUL49]|nr:peptidoglycan DD-metalloendopeptidase family protein [Alteromonas sp. KUL49]TAP42648.1 peptidase M23 [Alteromonas sp. KUL49]
MFSIAISLANALVFVGDAFAQQNDGAQETAQLEALQAELRERQRALSENQTSAKDVEAVLAQSEIEIGQVAKALAETRTELSQNIEEQQTLEAEQKQLADAIIQQQSLLSNQLKSAFMAGHYDYAKMIFYQQEARSFERMLTYYQYMSGARQSAIDEFKSTVAALKSVGIELAQKAQELSSLEQEQERQRANLLARQQDRRQTLVKLNALIATEAQRIERLKAGEQALLAAIEAARRAAERAAQQAEIALDGLAPLKGQLQPPVDGRVRNLFGNRRQGQVRWKGVIIDGSEGDAVRTIAPGKVLYADWLRGFGLVAIVDHGEGYMSVYGHNQALLKQAGDDVRQGESIALVGQSGGQSSPNLYFEIRHKGKALNPRSWLSR